MKIDGYGIKGLFAETRAYLEGIQLPARVACRSGLHETRRYRAEGVEYDMEGRSEENSEDNPGVGHKLRRVTGGTPVPQGQK
jgi:hypothetical protein